MAEVLEAALGGAQFGFEVAPGTHTGSADQFLLLLDPDRTGNSFADRLEHLVATLEASGVPRLPAERRYRNRTRARTHGVELGREAYDTLVAFASPR